MVTPCDSTPSAAVQPQTACPPVTLRRSGNLLEISLDRGSPLPSPARRVLEPGLSYQHKRFLMGMERIGSDGMIRRVEVKRRQLYRYDEIGRMVCGFGFVCRVQKLLQDAGIGIARYVVKTRPDHPRPDCYVSDKERVLRHFHYKARQEECLDAILANECGGVWAPTGFGKMVMIAMVCLALPNAKIDIITRRLRLVNKLVSFLTRYIPNVGQVDGSHKRHGHVTVYSAASLARSDFSADVILCDEAHELIAEEAAAQLARYRYSRNFSFTASPQGRADGADIRMEGLFGLPIFHMAYPEAVRLGLVVPIQVEWCDVYLNCNPCAGLDDVAKKRFGLWQNDARNQIIADKARTFGPDEQVMITVETIEHALHLRRHLPEFTLVYDKMEPRVFSSYKKAGLLPSDEPAMTPLRKEILREEFEKGKLKKAIATGVWHVGIDPVQLVSLIRADGAASEIMDIQAPGRVSRTHQAGGKSMGIVCDFRDQFDQGLATKAKKRYAHYKAMEWTQVLDTPSGLLPLVHGR